MPIAFLLLLLPRPHHRRQLQRESKVVFSLSLSLLDNCTRSKKKKKCWNIGNCKGIETEFPVMQMNPWKPFEMSVSNR